MAALFDGRHLPLITLSFAFFTVEVPHEPKKKKRLEKAS
jgi:hypothetical protein